VPIELIEKITIQLFSSLATFIELCAAFIIVSASLRAFIGFLFKALFKKMPKEKLAEQSLRIELGFALSLALEFELGADIPPKRTRTRRKKKAKSKRYPRRNRMIFLKLNLFKFAMPYSHDHWSNGININNLPVALRNRIYSGDGSPANPIKSESFVIPAQFLQFLREVVDFTDIDAVYGIYNDQLYACQKNQIIKFSNNKEKAVFPIKSGTKKNQPPEDYFKCLEEAASYILRGKGTPEDPYTACVSIDKFIISLQNLAKHSMSEAIYGLDEGALFKVTTDEKVHPILTEKEEDVLISKIKDFEKKIYEKISQLHLVLHQLCPLEDTGLPKNGKALFTTLSSPGKSFHMYYADTDLLNILNNIAIETADFKKMHPDKASEKQRLLSSEKKDEEKLEIEIYEDCLINDINKILQKVEGLIKKYPDIGSKYIDIKWKEETKTFALMSILGEAKEIIATIRK